MSPIRVLVADDQPLIRAGLKAIVDDEEDLSVVGEAWDGERAVQLAASLQPDVVLMDVRMPHLNGIEATRQIIASGERSPKVLILTTFDLDEYVYDGLRAGASGFLLKDVPPDDLVSAIRVVANGDAIVAPTITRRLLDRFAAKLPSGREEPAPRAASTLTEREHEVLILVARGLSNAEIAAELFVGEATVKTHVGNVLAGEARPARPGAGRGVRVRVRAGAPRCLAQPVCSTVGTCHGLRHRPCRPARQRRVSGCPRPAPGRIGAAPHRCRVCTLRTIRPEGVR